MRQIHLQRRSTAVVGMQDYYDQLFKKAFSMTPCATPNPLTSSNASRSTWWAPVWSITYIPCRIEHPALFKTYSLPNALRAPASQLEVAPTLLEIFLRESRTSPHLLQCRASKVAQYMTCISSMSKMQPSFVPMEVIMLIVGVKGLKNASPFLSWCTQRLPKIWEEHGVLILWFPGPCRDTGSNRRYWACFLPFLLELRICKHSYIHSLVVVVL